MGYLQSTKPFRMKCRFRKTILLSLFYIGVLFYLCLLARVNILNFKSSFVAELRLHLITQTRLYACHIQDRFEILTQKLSFETCGIANRKSTDDAALFAIFGLRLQGFYIYDRQGDIIQKVFENPTESPNASAMADMVKGTPQSGSVCLDKTETSRIWILTGLPNAGEADRIAAVAVAWDDWVRYLRTNKIPNAQIFFSDPQCRLADLSFCSSASDIFKKAAKGIEGTIRVNAKQDGADSKVMVGYCPVSLFNEKWPMAVVMSEKGIETAVSAHAEGIFAAMLCLFLVLPIFCGFYYYSEKRRLILEQQTELSRTTSELHLVATEKRQMSDQLKKDINFYQQILSAIPVGLYWKNEKGELMGQNRMLGQLLKVERSVDCLEQVDNPELDKEVLTKGIDLMHVPQTIKIQGRDHKILSSRIPLTDKNDRIIGMLNCQIAANTLDHLKSGCCCRYIEQGCLADRWGLPVLLVDLQLKIHYANAAFVRRIGLSQEQVVEQSIEKVLKISGSELKKKLDGIDSTGTWLSLQIGSKTVNTFFQRIIGGQDLFIAVWMDETLASEPIQTEGHDPVSSITTPETAQQAEAAVERPADILIVDDVEENRTLLEILITKIACRTETCSNGQQAVELSAGRKYDLILMDLQMPGMDGFEAMRQIRKGSVNRSTPMIAMTASENREDELTALECGFDDYLSKPINRKVMVQKIWRSLQKARQISDALAGKEIISFLDGNPDYRKAIEAFVLNLPARLEEMKEAFENRDLKSLSFKIHALKGIGGFAGFSVYTEKAKSIEDAIHEEQLEKVRRQLDELVNMCLRTRLKSDCP